MQDLELYIFKKGKFVVTQPKCEQRTDGIDRGRAESSHASNPSLSSLRFVLYIPLLLFYKLSVKSFHFDCLHDSDSYHPIQTSTYMKVVTILNNTKVGYIVTYDVEAEEMTPNVNFDS